MQTTGVVINVKIKVVANASMDYGIFPERYEENLPCIRNKRLYMSWTSFEMSHQCCFPRKHHGAARAGPFDREMLLLHVSFDFIIGWLAEHSCQRHEYTRESDVVLCLRCRWVVKF